MRRGTRQKLDGDGQDWVSKGSRRLLRLASRPGVGKATKRRLARRRRHLGAGELERDERD